jgi:hypothetical protein
MELFATMRECPSALPALTCNYFKVKTEPFCSKASPCAAFALPEWFILFAPAIVVALGSQT